MWPATPFMHGSSVQCALQRRRRSLRESEAYAEHLGAALPRLLPAAKRAAQRTSTVELAHETIEGHCFAA